MKKILLWLLAIGIIAGTAMFIFCNKRALMYVFFNKTTECKWEISSTEHLTFNLMNDTIGYNVDVRTRETEEMFVECVSQKANEEVFQFFKNYCASRGLVFGDKTMSFVIYYDSLVTQSLSITDEHIKGISAYMMEGDKIMHHLYVRDEQFNFSEIENVKVAVPSVTFNHIFFYLENYVFTNAQNVSFVILSGNFAVETDKKNEKNIKGRLYGLFKKEKQGLTFEITPKTQQTNHNPQ